LLLILLIVLLLGLGGLVYWQFGDKLLGLLNISGGGTTVDITAPEITDVEATASGMSAAITWVTDEVANTQVEYGETKENTSLSPAQPKDDPTTGGTGYVVTHSVELTDLEPGTKYYYRVMSSDAAGNEAVYPASDWKSFETAVLEE